MEKDTCPADGGKNKNKKIRKYLESEAMFYGGADADMDANGHRCLWNGTRYLTYK